MKLFRFLAPALLAILFIGGVSYNYAQGQTVTGAVIQVNQQFGASYTFLCSPPDGGKLVTFTSSAAVAVTLPQAGTSCFVQGWYTYVGNTVGTGTATITPTTSTIHGASTLAVAPASAYMIISDGTNYEVISK